MEFNGSRVMQQADWEGDSGETVDKSLGSNNFVIFFPMGLIYLHASLPEIYANFIPSDVRFRATFNPDLCRLRYKKKKQDT